jgi:hypothetical protein
MDYYQAFSLAALYNLSTVYTDNQPRTENFN